MKLSASAPGETGDCAMSFELWAGAIALAIVLVYLLAVLARPERF